MCMLGLYAPRLSPGSFAETGTDMHVHHPGPYLIVYRDMPLSEVRLRQPGTPIGKDTRRLERLSVIGILGEL